MPHFFAFPNPPAMKAARERIPNNISANSVEAGGRLESESQTHAQ
jgi:hypothetical protein